MDEKQKLLKDILNFEAKEAEWGSRASRAKKEYAKKYSNIQNGDKVIMYLKDGSVAYGISGVPRFDTHHGFSYQIEPTNSTFDRPTKRKAYYHFYNHPMGKNTDILRIERAK